MEARASVRWPSEDSIERNGIRGTVEIRQHDENSMAYYKVRLEGLRPKTLHGFHVHANPITSWKDLEKSCASCGGHFNPEGKEHGSVLNELPGERHAGDLINNIRADGHGRVRVEFWDDKATLIPSDDRPYTVIGKSLVIHEGTDDLGRQGDSSCLPYIDSQNIINYGSREDEVAFYLDPKKRAESLRTGNAGARLACGNIS